MIATWLSLPLVLGGGPSAAWLNDSHDLLLIRAERVIVRPGEELENAAVLVQDGRIAAVGIGLEAPEGARVVEGEVVCAGFVDCWSALGVDAASLRDAGTSQATQTVDALDSYDGDDLREQAVAAGVTTVRVQAGADSLFGGVGALVRVHPSLDGGDEVLLADAAAGSAVALGNRDVFDRAGQVDRLVSAIESGRKYRESQVEYRYELEEWQKEIEEKEEGDREGLQEGQEGPRQEEEGSGGEGQGVQGGEVQGGQASARAEAEPRRRGHGSRRAR